MLRTTSSRQLRAIALSTLLPLAAAVLAAAAPAHARAQSPGPAPIEVGAQDAAASPAEIAQSTPLIDPLAYGRVLELPELDPDLPSPADFLGYPLGSRFTHHHRVREYVQRLAEASPRVVTWTYGQSYEGRPLDLLAISAPENIERLDEIRREHLRLADPADLAPEEVERLATETPVVVWLAYGVHGNESSSAEAAMLAAYLFAAGGGEWEELLANTVVLIDPLVNPDGRERYVSWFERDRGRLPDPDPEADEHAEPWPGGRTNHYLIDLNRDWSWATQQETRFRLAAYRQWEPQVYVDYHEMFPASTYFFPPAAEPINPLLDPRTIGWLDVFGRGNAAAFDRQGWPYYKAEVFDLYYPGYGDSYPGFRGAVGMTYEVAGHGLAGIVLDRRDGTRLTLADRIAQHFTTSVATVRTAAENRVELLRTFAAARADATRRNGPVYLWEADVPEAGALAELLDLHGIRVGRLAGDTRIRARALVSPDGSTEERSFAAGSYVVDAGQPLGKLAQALLDRSPELTDEFMERQRARLEENVGTEFYDITSWSLPLAFNLDAWVAPGPVRELELAPAGAAAPGAVEGAGRVGFLVPPSGLAGYRFAAELFAEGVRFQVALDELSVGGETYPAGTFFVPRLGNGPEERDGAVARERPLDVVVAEAAGAAGVVARGVDTHYATTGLSLGSDRVPVVLAPKIALASGEAVSSSSFGYLWHLLDQQVRLPYTRIEASRLGGVALSDYQVLVLPQGSYADAFEGAAGDSIAAWVRGGGVLVAVGSAHRWLADKELTAVERWQAPEVEAQSEEEAENPLTRRAIDTPGAIVATELTERSPIAAGLPSAPPVLVAGSTVLLPTGDPQVDVLTAAGEAPVLTGVAWPEAEERLAGSLLVSLERVGGGAVVLFAHEPDFRLFWRGTAPLFLSSVLYLPSLVGSGY